MLKLNYSSHSLTNSHVGPGKSVHNVPWCVCTSIVLIFEANINPLLNLIQSLSSTLDMMDITAVCLVMYLLKNQQQCTGDPERSKLIWWPNKSLKKVFKEVQVAQIRVRRTRGSTGGLVQHCKWWQCRTGLSWWRFTSLQLQARIPWNVLWIMLPRGWSLRVFYALTLLPLSSDPNIHLYKYKAKYNCQRMSPILKLHELSSRTNHWQNVNFALNNHLNIINQAECRYILLILTTPFLFFPLMSLLQT